MCRACCEVQRKKQVHLQRQQRRKRLQQQRSLSVEMRCDVVVGRKNDSSESWSGVAALSCTDYSGSSSSGSDITEPGSPGSVSSGSSSSGCAPGRSPTWRWSPSHPHKRLRPLTDKCTNLEALISTKLLKHAASPPSPASTNYNNNSVGPQDRRKGCCAMPSESITAECRVLPQALADQCASIPKHIIHKTMPQQCTTSRATTTVEPKSNDDAKVTGALKIKQEKITEYFKSQMKPTNGLKRGEFDAWLSKAVAGKIGEFPIEGLECGDADKRFAVLALSPKVLLDHHPKIARKSASIVPKTPAEHARASAAAHKTEPEKMPLPRLNPIVDGGKGDAATAATKTDFEKTPRTEAPKTGARPAKPIRKPRAVDRKKPTIAPKINRKTQIHHRKEDSKRPAGFPAAVTNGPNSTPSVVLDASSIGVSDRVRQLLVKVQQQQQQPIDDASNIPEQQVPSVNRRPQIRNATHRPDTLVNSSTPLITSAASIPTVAMPPTMMLATIRVPDQGLPAPSRSDVTTTPATHISIASQTNINSQFVLPVMQNLNGTLVQIPGLVTKVGQSAMLPIPNQGIIAPQTPNGALNHSQMFINGTLLKINGHPNLPTLAKQITTNTVSNVSYAVSPKTISTPIGSKPNFTVNLNHPIFVSSQGFLLNSVGSVVTTQTTTGISHVQQAFTSNVVLTNPVHPGVHIAAPHISNAVPNLPLSSSTNIPISPLKLDGLNHHMFLTQHTQQQPPIFQPSDKLAEELSSQNCIVNMPQTFEKPNNPIVGPSAAFNHSVPKLDSIVDSIVSKSSEFSKLVSSGSQSSRISSTEKSKDDCQTPTDENETSIVLQQDEKSINPPEIDLESNKTDNSFMVSDETKSSLDSSLDLNRTNETPSVYSPDIEQTSSTSQTTTIRFPASKNCHSNPRNRPVRSSVPEVKLCQWNDCSRKFEDGSILVEHLQKVHVTVQAGKKTFKCLWQGCKVYNRTGSKSWLERHVLSHGGSKVFGCIVEGCGERFNTQLALQRHVNNHFTESESNISSAKKSVESNSAPKLFRRNGKRLRYRRQTRSARMFDYFDAGIMEGLQYRVVQVTNWRNGGAAGVAAGRSPSMSALYSQERTPHCVTMTATILARRINSDKLLPECLVRWTPPNVLEDEWLIEKDFTPVKEVPIASLDISARNVLYSSFCASYRSPESVNSSKLSRTHTFSCKDSVKKSINGFVKAVNGKILDPQYSHNNKLKTDRFNNCVNELHQNLRSDNSYCEENNSVLQVNKLSGAAKRKNGRQNSVTFPSRFLT